MCSVHRPPPGQHCDDSNWRRVPPCPLSATKGGEQQWCDMVTERHPPGAEHGHGGPGRLFVFSYYHRSGSDRFWLGDYLIP
jgi:hypothetical protein